MIAIISTTQRLLSYVIGRAQLEQVDTPGDWVGLKGTVPHDDEGYSHAGVVLTGNTPGVSVAAARWAIQEFAPELVLSFAHGSSANIAAMPGDLALATSCIKIAGEPVGWDRSTHSEPIQTTTRAYSVARKTVELLGIDHRSGGMVSTELVTRTVALKMWLHEAFEIETVDRDSYDIAQECIAADVPEFMMVRTILDPVHVVLPRYARNFGLRPRGLVWPRMLAYLLRNPTETCGALELVRNANRSRRILGEFLPRFLNEWKRTSS